MKADQRTRLIQILTLWCIVAMLTACNSGAKPETVNGGSSGEIGTQPASAPPPAKTEDIGGAAAEDLTIATELVIAESAFRPVVSPDENFVAHIRRPFPGEGGGDKIVVTGIPDGRLVARVDSTIVGLARIAWSADSKRILAMAMYGRGVVYDAWVVDVIEGQLLPLGGLRGFFPSNDEVIWTEPETAYVFENAFANGITRLIRLDLRTLTTESIGDQEAARAKYAELRVTPLDHAVVEFGQVRSPIAHQELAVYNKDGSYLRVLSTSNNEIYARSWTFFRSGRYVIREDGQTGNLHLLTIGKRARPPLSIAAAAATLPNPVDKRVVAEARQILERGEPIYADVFAPRVNPLTGETVGGTGQRKGVVRVSEISSDGAVIRGRYLREEQGLPLEGDVLAEFRSEGSSLRMSAMIGSLND